MIYIKIHLSLTNRYKFWVKKFSFCLQLIQPKFHGPDSFAHLLREYRHVLENISSMCDQRCELSQNIDQSLMVHCHVLVVIFFHLNFGPTEFDRSHWTIHQRHGANGYPTKVSLHKLNLPKMNLLKVEKFIQAPWELKTTNTWDYSTSWQLKCSFYSKIVICDPGWIYKMWTTLGFLVEPSQWAISLELTVKLTMTRIAYHPKHVGKNELGSHHVVSYKLDSLGWGSIKSVAGVDSKTVCNGSMHEHSTWWQWFTECNVQETHRLSYTCSMWEGRWILFNIFLELMLNTGSLGWVELRAFNIVVVWLDGNYNTSTSSTT